MFSSLRSPWECFHRTLPFFNFIFKVVKELPKIIHTHAYGHNAQICTHTRKSERIRTHMQTYAYTCTHTHTYGHICAHTHTCARIRTRADIDAHICANMRTYAECGREVHVAGFIIHVSCCAFNRNLSGAFFFFRGRRQRAQPFQIRRPPGPARGEARGN